MILNDQELTETKEASVSETQPVETVHYTSGHIL